MASTKTIDNLVSNLSSAAIEAKPISTDWSEGYTETWEQVYPDVDEWDLDTCTNYLDDQGFGYDEQDGEDDDDYLYDLREACREAVCEDDSFTPIFNFRYPLPDYRGYDGDDQTKLMGGNVVLVEYEGEFFLALTGCGMDLSWDICQAYIALGFLPPVHFCNDLPRLAGDDESDDSHFLVLAAALRSNDILASWSNRRLEWVRERYDAARATRARNEGE